MAKKLFACAALSLGLLYAATAPASAQCVGYGCKYPYGGYKVSSESNLGNDSSGSHNTHKSNPLGKAGKVLINILGFGGL